MKIGFITLLIALSLIQLGTALTCDCKCSDGYSFTLYNVAGSSSCTSKMSTYCSSSSSSITYSWCYSDLSGVGYGFWIFFGVVAFIIFVFVIIIAANRRMHHLRILRTHGHHDHHKDVGVYHSGVVVTTGHEMTPWGYGGHPVHGVPVHGVPVHGVPVHGVMHQPVHGTEFSHGGSFTHGYGHGGSFTHGGNFGHVGGHH